MHMPELSCWIWELYYAHSDVSTNLGGLTGDTYSTPYRDVSLYIRPYKPHSYLFASGFSAEVREPVDQIENF